MTPSVPVALDPARYAIAGFEPLSVWRPATREEAAELLRVAARDGLAVVPWGGGVALPRARPPERYDLALDLTALDSLVEYEPADLTVTAGCGITLAALRAALAAHGQELPLEGARPERATLGGVLAANASGPRRMRLGAPRDRVLGARFALGEGTIAHTGGRVVKNVAGYAVHRLLCGARGGLAVLLEASLKLVPAPAARVALVYGVGPRILADAARWTGLPRLEPAVLTVVGRALAGDLPVSSPTDPYTLVVGFEDDGAHVDRQAAKVERLLGEPDARLVDDSAATLWQSLADLEDRDGVHLACTTAANTPAALAPLLAAPGEADGMLFHAAAGRLHLFPERASARAAFETLTGAGFALIESTGLPGGVAGPRELAPLVAPQAAVLALRARVRAALDPAGVMALGPRWERGETG